MKQYDGVIFDLDGALWDAAEASAKGWNSALQSCGVRGFKVSADDIRGVSGKPFDVCVQTVFPRLPASSRLDVLRALEAHERDVIEVRGGRVFEGVVEGIQQLSDHYKLFLISNCQEWYLESFWKQFGLQRFFSDWDCHGSSRASKAAMIEAVVHRYGLDESIYIGDTEGDSLAADAAHVDFGYVSYGFGQVEDATVIFSSFGELVAWFQKAAAA